MRYCGCKLCLNPAKWVLISDSLFKGKRFYVCKFCVDEVQGLANGVVDAINTLSGGEDYSVIVREI